MTFASFRLFVKLVAGNPAPFVFLYTSGNVMSLMSSMFLSGPSRQFRLMFDERRRTTSISYLAALAASIIVCFLPLPTGARIGLLVSRECIVHTPRGEIFALFGSLCFELSPHPSVKLTESCSIWGSMGIHANATDSIFVPVLPWVCMQFFSCRVSQYHIYRSFPIFLYLKPWLTSRIILLPSTCLPFFESVGELMVHPFLHSVWKGHRHEDAQIASFD